MSRVVRARQRVRAATERKKRGRTRHDSARAIAVPLDASTPKEV